jgi:hypothetical protein
MKVVSTNEPPASEAKSREIPEVEAQAPVNLTRPAFALGFGGGVLLAGGGASLLVAKGRYDAIAAQQIPPATALQYRNEGPVWQTTGWILICAGVAAAGTSAVLFAVSANREVEATAMVLPGGAAIGLAGIFP